MIVVFIATAWGSSEGGVNAFNHSLAIGLTQAFKDVRVCCAIPSPSTDEISAAAAFGIEVIPVSGEAKQSPAVSCAGEVVAWLAARELAGPDLWVGHDIVTGDAAVEGSRMCGKAALIHHMSYIEYYNAAGGRGDATLDKHAKQRRLFSDENAIVFGVGSALTRHAETLGATKADCLIPGFPENFTKNISKNENLRIVVAGRFDADAETLKQSRLAAAALGQAVKDAGGNIRCLENPTLIIFGASSQRIEAREFELLTSERAGRRINVVVAEFNGDPNRIIGEMTSSNLVILPSFHEGFGLVGWEAIGCEVPLILGRETGLYKFVSDVLGGQGLGCLHHLDIRGGDLEESDVTAMADAIRKVARDLDEARRDAQNLRRSLKTERGCTWADTARDLLVTAARSGTPLPASLADAMLPALAGGRPQPAGAQVTLRPQQINHFELCAELEVSTGQGSSARDFDLIVQLRFGVTPVLIDDLSADIFVKEAALRVTTEGGRLTGARLGEGLLACPGLRVDAGGVWALSPVDGCDHLRGRALGDDALCRITATSDVPVQARIELTSSLSDFGCRIRPVEGEELSVAQQRIMEVFLKKAIRPEGSHQILLSEANFHPEIENAD